MTRKRANDVFMIAITEGVVTSRESEAGNSDSRKEKLVVNDFFSGRSRVRFQNFSGRSSNVLQILFLEEAPDRSIILRSIFTCKN